MKEEFSKGVLHNIKGNVGYNDCSKYLAYSVFEIKLLAVESF